MVSKHSGLHLSFQVSPSLSTSTSLTDTTRVARCTNSLKARQQNSRGGQPAAVLWNALHSQVPGPSTSGRAGHHSDSRLALSSISTRTSWGFTNPL